MTTCSDCKGKGYIELLYSSQPCDCQSKPLEIEKHRTTNLVDKWSKTGLLRGLSETDRDNMSRMLPAEKAEVLREPMRDACGRIELRMPTIEKGPWNQAAKNLHEYLKSCNDPQEQKILEPFTSPEIQKKLWNSIEARHAINLDCMSMPASLTFYTKVTPPSEQQKKERSLDIEIVQQSIIAETRKLKRSVTEQMWLDKGGRDQFTDFLIEVAALEIDQEIFGDLISAAEENGFVGVRDSIGLADAIRNASNQMYKRNFRGLANVAYMSNKRLYENHSEVELIKDRVRVIGHRAMPENKVLLAFRGASVFDAGYTYHPYIVPFISSVIVSPEDFSPRRCYMMRRGKAMIQPENFHVLKFEEQK